MVAVVVVVEAGLTTHFLPQGEKLHIAAADLHTENMNGLLALLLIMLQTGEGGGAAESSFHLLLFRVAHANHECLHYPSASNLTFVLLVPCSAH